MVHSTHWSTTRRASAALPQCHSVRILRQRTNSGLRYNQGRTGDPVESLVRSGGSERAITRVIALRGLSSHHVQVRTCVLKLVSECGLVSCLESAG